MAGHKPDVPGVRILQIGIRSPEDFGHLVVRIVATDYKVTLVVRQFSEQASPGAIGFNLAT